MNSGEIKQVRYVVIKPGRDYEVVQNINEKIPV